MCSDTKFLTLSLVGYSAIHQEVFFMNIHHFPTSFIHKITLHYQNSYLWPLLVVRTPSMRTLQLGVATFVGPYENPWGLLMAANVIATLPTLILFFFLQRQLMTSITMTGIKG